MNKNRSEVGKLEACAAANAYWGFIAAKAR